MMSKEKIDLQRPLPESDRGTGTAGDCNTRPRDVTVLYIEPSKPNAENPSFSPALLGWCGDGGEGRESSNPDAMAWSMS